MSYPTVPLVLATALLLLVAGWDIAKRRIPNWANAALGVTGIAGQAICHGGWAALAGVGAGLVTLVVLWVPWSKGRLGGGDVKATVGAAVWVGFGLLFRFYIVAALAVGAVALLCFAASSASIRREISQNMKLVVLKVGLPEAPIRGGSGRVSVPFGAAAAAAAIFLLWSP
jgi:Flp pilus assembly protein protease CpaA